MPNSQIARRIAAFSPRNRISRRPCVAAMEPDSYCSARTVARSSRPASSGPVPGVRQSLVARGPDPGAERIGGRVAGGSRAEDADRRIEIVDIRRDLGVQEREADASQQLVLVVREVARKQGHDVLDVGQDDADDVRRVDRGHGTECSPRARVLRSSHCRLAQPAGARIAEIASGLRGSGIRPWTHTTSALGSGDLPASGSRREGGVGGIRLRSSPPHKPVTERHPRRPITGPRAESERSGSAFQTAQGPHTRVRPGGSAIKPSIRGKSVGSIDCPQIAGAARRQSGRTRTRRRPT